MDIYCPKCREPWDLDTFHEVAAEQEITFDAALAAFKKDGCKATGWAKCPEGAVASPLIAEVYDLLGDDIDGAAALLDDADYLGLLS